MAENLLEGWTHLVPPSWAVERCPYEVVVNPDTVIYLLAERRRWLSSDAIDGEYFFTGARTANNARYSYRFSSETAAVLFKISHS